MVVPMSAKKTGGACWTRTSSSSWSAGRKTYRFQEIAKGAPPLTGARCIQKWAFDRTPKAITVTSMGRWAAAQAILDPQKGEGISRSKHHHQL